jgi:glycosyltransferase involved in cell wall biosynthesis
VRIGIDARFLTHPQMGGFKTYSENLIRAILNVDEVNQYVIYIDRAPADGSLPQKQNCLYKVVGGANSVGGMPIREQIYLRSQIAKDRLDLIHFLCNTTTIGLSDEYVLTLHDTIQITEHKEFWFSRSDLKNLALTWYSKWVILMAVKNARRIIAVSHYEKDQILQRLPIPPERIQVIYEAPNPIYSPVDCDLKDQWRTEIINRYHIRGKFILGVGYEPRKNIPLLMKAFSLVSSKLFDHNLVVVASNEQRRQYFQQLAKQLNLNEQVVIVGRVPDLDMLILYNLTEVFVFPSEREGFGLPPLEAIACGAPTLVMHGSSLPEILQDGVLYISDNNPQTLADGILRVVMDQDLRAKLIARGLQRASEFSWYKCAQETIDVYNRVASARKAMKIAADKSNT